MKQIKIAFAFAAIISVAACSKLTVKSPTFSVQPLSPRAISGDTFDYKLTDTIRYTFSGFAQYVTFYNGTQGQRYDFSKDSLATGNPVIIFTNQMTNVSAQTGTLQLLVTKSIGVWDSTHVVNASWTDITSKVPSISTGTVAGPDTVSLADMVTSLTDSAMIAFKYTAASGSVQPSWKITNYSVVNMIPATSIYSGTNYVLSNLSTDASYWYKVNVAGNAWASSTSALTVAGGDATAAATSAWIVSKPLYLQRTSADLPSQIVRYLNSAYQYGPFTPTTVMPYTVAGLYKVTFVYFNATIDDQKGSAISFYIRITN